MPKPTAIEYDTAFEVTASELECLRKRCGMAFCWRIDNANNKIWVKVWMMSRLPEILKCLR